VMPVIAHVLLVLALVQCVVPLKFDRKRIDDAMQNLERVVVGGGGGKTTQTAKLNPRIVSTVKEREIYMCTFSVHAPASGAHNRLIASAVDSNRFDHVKVYSPRNPPAGLEYASLVIPQKHIYGPKFSKPYAVLETMRMARPQDIIVFVESNAMFHSGAEQDSVFEQYIDDISRSVSKRLCFAMEERPEYKYTRGDVFDLISGRNSTMHEMPQVTSDFFMLQNTKDNREIMEAWIEIMQTEDYHFLIDAQSFTPNLEGFVEHSAETSIFSCLMKLEGFFMEKLPSQDELRHYPISLRGSKYT
jgi:hypothetical protein